MAKHIHLFQSPMAIEAYIHHTADGMAMQEVARLQDAKPSTVLRQVRKIKELQDNPEWNVILSQLALTWDRKTPIDSLQAFGALGVTVEDVTKEMQLALPLLVRLKACIGVTKDCVPGVFVDNEIVLRIDRRIVTAWVAIGWLSLTTESSRVRRYCVTDQALAEVPEALNIPPVFKVLAENRLGPNTARALHYTPQVRNNEPIEKLWTLARRKSSIKITETEIRIAQRIRYLMHKAELEGKGGYTLMLIVYIEKRLGKDMFNLLYDFLHRNLGFEQIEKNYSWPRRSAKVVLSIALQQIQHFGILEQEEFLLLDEKQCKPTPVPIKEEK